MKSFWHESDWFALPKKQQLGLIFVSRFWETLTTSSEVSFLYLQLQSFPDRNGALPDDALTSFRLSLVAAALIAPQSFMGILWGRLADSPRVGRKNMLMAGLIGRAIASIGCGCSKSFLAVLLWSCFSGAMSGNLPIMRAMIKEMAADEFQSRALLLLPLAFNAGIILGPSVAALQLQLPPLFPGLPYALPYLSNGFCLLASAGTVLLRLEETMPSAKQVSRWRFSFRVPWRQKSARYTPLAVSEELDLSHDVSSETESAAPRQHLLQVWTTRLSLVLVARALLATHVGAYQSLLISFLYTPRASSYNESSPLAFTGGLAFTVTDTAAAFAVRGVGGVIVQMLFFPYLKARFGTLRLYQYSLVLFPISYIMTPFLAITPSTAASPHPASGPLLWITITLVLTVQTVARSFALPAATMLLNEACPHQSVLGTLNGIGQSVSAIARTLGPAFFGWLFGFGLDIGMVGLAWWTLATVAIMASLASLRIK